jgi:hypothetical protein
MKIVNSNKRYSTIIAGILVISFLSILVAFLIGFGDDNIYKQDGVQRGYIGLPSDSEGDPLDIGIGKHKNVPVAKRDDVVIADGIDTVPGSFTPGPIYIDLDSAHDLDLSDDKILGSDDPSQAYVFPLCLKDDSTTPYDMSPWGLADEDYLVGWYTDIIVCGGYTPEPWDTWIDIDQTKTGKGGRIYIWWVEDETYSGTCCCEKKYFGVFMVANIDGTDDKVCLDANHIPSCQQTLDKWVTVKMSSKWAGCNQWYQRFMYILVHKKL